MDIQERSTSINAVCDECDQEVDKVISFDINGELDCGEFWLCKDCLIDALGIINFKKEKKENDDVN